MYRDKQHLLKKTITISIADLLLCLICILWLVISVFSASYLPHGDFPVYYYFIFTILLGVVSCLYASSKVLKIFFAIIFCLYIVPVGGYINFLQSSSLANEIFPLVGKLEKYKKINGEYPIKISNLKNEKLYKDISKYINYDYDGALNVRRYKRNNKNEYKIYVPGNLIDGCHLKVNAEDFQFGCY